MEHQMPETNIRNFNPNIAYDLLMLPPTDFDHEDREIQKALLKTSEALAPLKYMKLPNAWVLIAPYSFREPVASMGIENIQTTVGDALTAELFPRELTESPSDREARERYIRADKAVRYRDALNYGFEMLESMGSISTRLIYEIRSRVMNQHTDSYRHVPNPLRNTRNEITYTPPAASRVNELMSNWENFVNNITANDYHPIIKSILAHYQFESIHPFEDGNGRTGRVLMILQLILNKVIYYPVLPISEYLTQNRPQYYERLRGINADGNWKDYVLFMLKAIELQSNEAVDLLKKIEGEYFKTKKLIDDKFNFQGNVVDQLFVFPWTTQTRFGEAIGRHYMTAKRYLEKLAAENILYKSEIAGRREVYYVNKTLYKLMTGEEFVDFRE